MPALIAAALAVVCALLARRSMRRDPRWMGNAVLLSVTVLSGLVAVLLSGISDLATVVFVVVVALSPLLVLVLTGFLCWNGVELLRREGVSVAHALPLALGMALIAVVALSVAGVLANSGLVFCIAMWAILLTAWFGALLLGYIVYGQIYAALVRSRHPDYVVTLGAGLLGDRVTPLLARRIDTALSLYARGRAAGCTPVLVMSGGQGSDEAVPEGRAMAAYAVARGVDPRDVVVEDRSASTEQNLRFTTELVRADPRLGPTARGVAVTSNYHALRAAILARSLQLPLDAVGAPVAWYFWPGAVLREFVAVLRPRWQLHALLALLVCTPLPAFFAYALLTR